MRILFLSAMFICALSSSIQGQDFFNITQLVSSLSQEVQNTEGRRIDSLETVIRQLIHQLHELQLSTARDIAVPGPVPPAAAVKSNPEKVIEPQLTGFFDINNSYSGGQDDEIEFSINQAEIDFENRISEGSAVSVAIAYNSDEAVFELATAQIDFELYHSESSFVTSAGLAAGQFDVPFGRDFCVYACPDRKLVTTPPIVELTHGGWNDLGIQGHFSAGLSDAVFYVANGFESSAEILDEAASLAAGYEVFEEIDTTPAFALGARFDFSLMSGIRLGTSIASGWNASDENEMRLYGVDALVEYAQTTLKGEYIYHEYNRSISQSQNKGFYLQGIQFLRSNIFITARYDAVEPFESEWIHQSSLGLGYVIVENIEARIESIIHEKSNNNQTILQIVAAF